MGRYLWHSMPRHVRKDLAVNIIGDCASELNQVYPGLRGRKLMAEVEDLLEDIVRRAVKFAPSQSTIYHEGVMQRAVQSLVSEAPSQDKRDLYLAIWERLALDWYYGST